MLEVLYAQGSSATEEGVRGAEGGVRSMYEGWEERKDERRWAKRMLRWIREV